MLNVSIKGLWFKSVKMPIMEIVVSDFFCLILINFDSFKLIKGKNKKKKLKKLSNHQI